MREIFADAVKDPRVTLIDGEFEKTGVEGGWADVIIMATVSGCTCWRLTHIYLSFAVVSLVSQLCGSHARVCSYLEARRSRRMPVV